MKALAFKRETGLTLAEDYPMPQIGPGEALIQVRRSGICNTDLEILRGYQNFEGVPGHEFVGMVAAVGNPADEVKWLGRRVVGDINAACGVCETCRANRPHHCPNRTTLGIANHDGAFAEYLRLPVANLYAVPDSVPDEIAVFTEPLAAACEILEQVHLKPTDRVAVIGDGKLGLLVTQVLRLTGCDLTLIGRHERNGNIVARQGVRYLSGLAGAELKGAFGECDVVVECTGNQEGLETAKLLVRPAGTIVLKSTYHGLASVPLSLYVVDEINIVGSRCGPFDAALRLLERGLIDVTSLTDYEFKLTDGLAAFEQAAAKGTLKVLLKP